MVQSLIAAIIAGLAYSASAASEPPLAAKAPFAAEQTKELQQERAKHLGKPVGETNSIRMKLVLIPPGELTMGTTGAEREKMLQQFRGNPIYNWFRGNSKGEVPAHRVKITKAFYLAATQVTVGQFRKFVESTGYKTDVERPSTLGGSKGGLAFAPGYPASKKWYGWRRKPGYTWRNVGYEQPDDQPVFNVSWNDAVAFYKWLTEEESFRYRLPTEAEWEYACRAGSTTWWSFGAAEKLGDYGWYSTNSNNKPHPVGAKKRNAWGLWDVQGNLFEWCADWKDADYYKRSPVEDPRGPSASPSGTRVLRGGSFDGYPLTNRPAFRVQAHPQIGFFHIGFRVARDLDDKSSAEPGSPPGHDRVRPPK